MYKVFPIHEVIAGFFILCLYSSIGYIINDIYNIEEDKKHIDKKNRPLPSGKISVSLAIIISIVLIVIAGVLGRNIPLILGISSVLLFIDYIYTTLLRNKLMGVLSISIKYPMRLLCGFIIIGVFPDISLMILILCLALFQASFKIIGESNFRNVSDTRIKDFKNLRMVALIGFSISGVMFFMCNHILAGILFIFFITIRMYQLRDKLEYSKSLSLFKDKILFGLIITLGLVVLLEIYII